MLRSLSAVRSLCLEFMLGMWGTDLVFLRFFLDTEREATSH